MSPRITGVLFLVAALLGAFIHLYELADEGEESSAASGETRLFPDVEASAIDRITLSTTEGERAVLIRSGSGWNLLAPVRSTGDDVTLDAIASALAQLVIEGRVAARGEAEPPLEKGEFGLSDGGNDLLFQVGDESRGLRIGSQTPVGSNTYVKTLESDEIVYVETWRTNALRKTLTELRDRRVLRFDHAAIDKLSIAWSEGSVVLEKREDGWWLTEPINERADGTTVETLLSDLAFLRADDFIDDRPEGDALGLASPQLQILLGGRAGGADAGVGGGGEEGERRERGDVSGGIRLGFAVGALKDGRYAARGTAGELFWIEERRMDEIPRDLVAYRFKDVSRFAVADARSFELVFASSEEGGETMRIEGELSNGRWLTRPLSLDPAKVSAMVAELARLEGSDIFADALGDEELAAIGLSPPRIAIRVWGEDEEPLADLALGRSDPGRGILAQQTGTPVVYAVEQGLFEHIPSTYAAAAEDFLEEESVDTEEATPAADDPGDPASLGAE